jgi:hypothetical protein
MSNNVYETIAKQGLPPNHVAQLILTAGLYYEGARGRVPKAVKLADIVQMGKGEGVIDPNATVDDLVADGSFQYVVGIKVWNQAQVGKLNLKKSYFTPATFYKSNGRLEDSLRRAYYTAAQNWTPENAPAKKHQSTKGHAKKPAASSQPKQTHGHYKRHAGERIQMHFIG